MTGQDLIRIMDRLGSTYTHTDHVTPGYATLAPEVADWIYCTMSDLLHLRSPSRRQPVLAVMDALRPLVSRPALEAVEISHRAGPALCS
jgi:hypothetical protein